MAYQSFLSKLSDDIAPYEWEIYYREQIMEFFGEDVSGIDICCVKGNNIVAVILDQDPTDSQIKNMAHFIYSCAIIKERQKESHSGKVVTKIWACTELPHDDTKIAAGRKDVEIIHKIEVSLARSVATKIFSLEQEKPKLFTFFPMFPVAPNGVTKMDSS
jgi:hypothetical protein